MYHQYCRWGLSTGSLIPEPLLSSIRIFPKLCIPNPTGRPQWLRVQGFLFNLHIFSTLPKRTESIVNSMFKTPNHWNRVALQSTIHCFFGVKGTEIQVFSDSNLRKKAFLFRHTIITKLTAANVMSTYFVRKPLFRVSYLTLITRHLYYFLLLITLLLMFSRSVVSEF